MRGPSSIGLCDPGFRSGVEAAAPDRTEDPAAILLGALDATEGALREAQRGLAAIVQAFLAAHAQTLAVLTPEVAAVVATRVSYLLTRLDRRVFCLRDGCHRPSTLTVMRPGKQAGIYFVHVSVRGDRPGPHRWDPSTQGFELELVEHAPDDAGR